MAGDIVEGYDWGEALVIRIYDLIPGFVLFTNATVYKKSPTNRSTFEAESHKKGSWGVLGTLGEGLGAILVPRAPQDRKFEENVGSLVALWLPSGSTF